MGLTSLLPPPANDHSLETCLKEVVVLVAPSPGDEALLVKMIQRETTPPLRLLPCPGPGALLAEHVYPVRLGPPHAALSPGSHVADHSACPLLPDFRHPWGTLPR